MEQKKEKFALNSYVIFKNGQEYYEGRINNVETSSASENFDIFCFSTFTHIKVPVSEILSNMSQEIKRKMKSTPFIEIPNITHFPHELKNVLIVDKEWSLEGNYPLPHKYSIYGILEAFKIFLIEQASFADLDETEEIIKGFTMCFNHLFKIKLIYENEREQVESNLGDPVDFCGPIHLLRLIYYIQKKAQNHIADFQTKNILLDYSVYLLDFLLLNFNEYF